jgi:branched-chain amino acid transport system permease protein
LFAGLLVGVVAAVYALIVGSFQAQGTDLRPYLSMVSPDAIRLFLFNQNAAVGAIAHFALFTLSGLAGSALAYGSRHMNWRKAMGSRFTTLVESLRINLIVDLLRRYPYAVYVMYALLAVLMFFLPRVWGSYWNYIVGTVGIYVILGLGLNIIVGLAGQLVLGYVAFFAIGAYTVALLTAPQPHSLGWNFWPALLVGIALSALTGILLGLPILRLRGDYLAIVTLGFGEIIRIMLRSDVATPLTAGPRGVRDIVGPSIFGNSLASDIDFVYLITLAVLLSIFISDRLHNSRTGRAWVAIREDEIAARAAGINTFQSKLLALAIGAAFAGLGGVLFASRNQFTGPEDHVLMVSINVLALVIVGGLGSTPGIILGAFALKGLPEILRELENYRLLVFGGLLVVMMIWRPEGLWPASRPRLEKHEEITPSQEAVQSAEVKEVKHAS